MIDHTRVPVCIRPEYIIKLQYEPAAAFLGPGGGVFIHLDVFKWTPSVCKALQQHAADIVSQLGAPIYAVRTPLDEKHPKFLSMMGFKRLGYVETDRLKEIWVRNHGS